MHESEDNNSTIERVIRTRQEAKSHYNKLSGWYDFLTGSSERKTRDRGLEILHVREGERSLVIGFGTGHGVLSLAQKVGDSGKVYGIDISERMLDITQARVQGAGLGERVKLSCGDALKLPFYDEFFDVVFMSFTLELFDTPEIPIVLQECRRVLKRGGRICVVAMSKEGKDRFMIKLYEWIHRRLPGYVDCRPIHARDAIEQAGLRVVECLNDVIWGLPVEIVKAENS